MKAPKQGRNSSKIEFTRATLWRNFQAGTTTAVVIIPQGMAYALVAGLPPIHGLYASLLPLVAYAFIGQSRELAVGPGALDTLLLGSSLAAIEMVNAANYGTYAAVLTLEVAAIQLALGLLRGGFLVNFLSRPVLSGFTSAAALTIALSQMKNLFGYAVNKSSRFDEMLAQLATGLPKANFQTATIGVGSVLLLLGLKRLRKGFPAPLLVTALAILLVRALQLQKHGVAILGAIPAGLPRFIFPRLDTHGLLALAPTALTIAFVGYLTNISIAKTFAARNRYDINANRELFATGTTNLVAGLSQGFPVSASFSRSAVHASAGSTSPYTLLITAGWVGLTLAFLTDYFYSLPKATLAAVIITAVSGLVDLKSVSHLWRVERSDMWLLLTTFAATLVIGIEQGILIGVACSLGLFIYRTTRPHTAVLGRLGDTSDYRNVKHYPNATTYPGILIVRFDAQFYFGNVTFFKDLMRRLENEAPTPLHTVIVEACSLTQLDSSADATLNELADDYQRRGVNLCFASVKFPILRVMKASGLWSKLGEDHFFMNVDDAVRHYDESSPCLKMNSTTWSTPLS